MSTSGARCALFALALGAAAGASGAACLPVEGAVDAGTVFDAGADAGDDAGTAPSDAGDVPADAGPQPDASDPGDDAGTPQTDAGFLPAFDPGSAADGGLPAWRQAMMALDTLYNVSAAPPAEADATIDFPGGAVPYGFGVEGYGWDVMSGYSSGTLLEDVGTYGTMVFGTGGHTRLQNQLLSLTLSADAPTFGWFQQPYFETNDVNGAELYWDPAAFAALPATQRTGEGYNTEGPMTQAWIAAGGAFPMGYEGWIFPRKMVLGQLGNNHPHGFRYMAPSYIPAALTGTGAGAFVIVEAPQGPFVQSWKPEGSSASDIMDPAALWPSGGRKWPIWALNTSTRAWVRLPALQPDYAPYGFVRQHTAVAADQKRIYVSVDVGNQTASFWYIDLSDGIAGATTSNVVIPANPVDPNRNTTGVFTAGHPTGRHLWFWPDLHDAEGFCVQDLDAATQYRVHVGQGLSIAIDESVGMQYDPVNNRMVILQHLGDGALVYRVVPIPEDPSDPAAYVVSAARPLAVDPSVAQPVAPTHLYGKARLHPALGVMLVPQASGPMLAFRPSL